MICIVTSLSVTFVMYFNGRNQDILFILFICYEGPQPHPRQRSASIVAAHIWIFCVAWTQRRHQLSQSRRFPRDFFQLWSWKLPCIIHALGEQEVYRRKCFFEFFWCWDFYPSGRFVLQVSRLPNTGVELGHVKMFRALQAIGKFRIPRRPWDELDCEANAGQLLCKNKHKWFVAESLENDRNLKNRKISKLKLYQRDICCKQQNCGKSWSYLT